jgi:hypothetical protein
MPQKSPRSEPADSAAPQVELRPHPTREQHIHAAEMTRVALYDEARAVQALRDYYDPAGRYAGATFLDLPNEACNITAADLYALSTLNVHARPLAGRRLLYPGSYRIAVLAALASPNLPADADLRTAPEPTWEAAATLYDAVKAALGGDSWVTASKLCARKRPSFFPVRDSVVTERLLGLGRSYETDWAVYKQLVLERKRQRVLIRIIEVTSNQLGFKITDPHLRVLDVILWATAPSEFRHKRW